MRLTVYYNPACNTCRTVEELLKQRGVEYELRRYLNEPLGYDEARRLLELLGTPARQMLRDKDCEELGIDDGPQDDKSLLKALEANPRLLRRPIVSDGERAMVARPANTILEWLDD